MRKKEARLLVFVFLWSLLILPGLGQADGAGKNGLSTPSGGKFSLKLYGGKSYSALGDINDSIEGIKDRFKDLPYIDFLGPSPQKINAGFEAGGEALVNLIPRLTVGIGAGYLRASRENTFMSKWWFGSYTYEDYIFYRVSATYFGLNLHLVFPLWKILNWTAHVGADYYFGRLTSDSGWSSPELRTSNEETWEGAANTHGFHGGLGLELNIFSRLAFLIEGTVRYAKLKDLKGEFRRALRLGAENIDTEKDAGLWSCDYFDSWTKKTYPILYIGRYKPLSSEYKNVRKAIVDLSGFSVRAGLKIRLF